MTLYVLENTQAPLSFLHIILFFDEILTEFLKTCQCCDSGLNPAAMRGSKTGVYIGVSGSEAAEAFSRDPEELLGYSMTGCQHAMLANRLSYFFDFTGTCLQRFGPKLNRGRKKIK